MWLLFAFSGPILWAASTHIDKYLVDKYFRHSDTAVLMVFTALLGVVALPVIWAFEPKVLQLSAVASLRCCSSAAFNTRSARSCTLRGSTGSSVSAAMQSSPLPTRPAGEEFAMWAGGSYAAARSSPIGSLARTVACDRSRP